MSDKFQILVVDDNHDKSEMLAVALGMEGYDVRTVANGQEALAIMESVLPDLVVSDVMMPEVDGYELARRMRENPATRFIPIILQSASQTQPKNARQGADAGALGFISDPVDLGLLVSQARTLLAFRNYLDTCEEAALTDHLTGLANRRRFERHLELELERTARYGRPFCVVVWDIDDFKNVNDTFGHEAGDKALRHISNTLQEGIRGVDLAARFGGDELALILTETTLARGIEVVERLSQAIRGTEIRVSESVTTTITASFGIAESLSGTQSMRELLAFADGELYAAKALRRDRMIRNDGSNGTRRGRQTPPAKAVGARIAHNV